MCLDRQQLTGFLTSIHCVWEDIIYKNCLLTSMPLCPNCRGEPEPNLKQKQYEGCDICGKEF